MRLNWVGRWESGTLRLRSAKYGCLAGLISATTSSFEVLRERLRVQVRAGGVLGQPVPAQRPARLEHLLLHELADLLVADVDHRRRVGPVVDLPGDRVVHLRGEQLRPSCSCGSRPGR